MVSLWGSKNGEERSEAEGETGDEASEDRQPSRRSGGPDPDERTRLLPPRNDGFLDPDDPAVRTVCCFVMTYVLISPGIALQPMECSSSSLPVCSLPCHQFSLVGLALGFDIRQSAYDAFTWIWLLRFLLHDSHNR